MANYQKLHLHNVVLLCCTEAKSRPARDVLDPCKIFTGLTFLGKTPNATPYYNGLTRYSSWHFGDWVRIPQSTRKKTSHFSRGWHWHFSKMAVFTLKAHYPSGRTCAKIISSAYASLVQRRADDVSDASRQTLSLSCCVVQGVFRRIFRVDA